MEIIFADGNFGAIVAILQNGRRNFFSRRVPTESLSSLVG